MPILPLAVHPRLRIAVVGDRCTDIWHIGEFTRFAPEGGQPVFLESDSFSVPGMAGNVHRHLSTWNVDASLFGCWAGNKHRYVGSGHYSFRVDEEFHISDSERRLQLDEFKGAAKRFNAVIISDYDKGTLNIDCIAEIVRLCKDLDIPCFADPKGKHPEAYSGCETLKCNTAYSERYKEDIGCADAVVTDGAGCVYHKNFTIPSKRQVLVKSVVGAGDAFIAAMAANKARGSSLHDACTIAYSAGRVAVQKSYSEIASALEIAKDIDPVLGKIAPDALQLRQDCAGRVLGVANGCFRVPHIGHARMLSWAKQNCDILLVAANSDVSLSKISRKSPLTQDQRLEMLASLECVDFVVTFDEETPAELFSSLKPDRIFKGHDACGQQIVGSDLAAVYFAPPSGVDLHSSDLLFG